MWDNSIDTHASLELCLVCLAVHAHHNYLTTFKPIITMGSGQNPLVIDEVPSADIAATVLYTDHLRPDVFHDFNITNHPTLQTGHQRWDRGHAPLAQLQTQTLFCSGRTTGYPLHY